MKKVLLILLLSIILVSCSNSNETVVIDDQGNKIITDDKNTILTDPNGNVKLNSTTGSDSWCSVGTSVKSDIADTKVIGIENIQINGFGSCNSCHYIQISLDKDYKSQTDWWKSENDKCDRSVLTNGQDVITTERWVNSENKECNRQLLNGQVSFESCT